MDVVDGEVVYRFDVEVLRDSHDDRRRTFRRAEPLPRFKFADVDEPALSLDPHPVPGAGVDSARRAALRRRTCLSPTPPTTPTALCSALRDLRKSTDEGSPAWRAFGDLLDEDTIPWIGERVAIAVL